MKKDWQEVLEPERSWEVWDRQTLGVRDNMQGGLAFTLGDRETA